MSSLDLSKLITSTTPLEASVLISKKECDPNSYNPTGVLDWCLNTFSSGECPADGRNDWLTKLAHFCNERGVLEHELLSWSLAHSPLITHGEKRITSTIAGIYKRKRSVHNSQPYAATLHNGKNTTVRGTAVRTVQPTTQDAAEAFESPILPAFSDTPFIPESVYSALPLLLRQVVEPLDASRERDVLLTGALAVLSGCFPDFSGEYDGVTYRANIFTFIVAPQASGKGILRWARTLGAPAHTALVAESKCLKDKYEADLADYTLNKRSAKGTPVPPAPVEPPSRLLYIPGNNSAANIFRMLHENDGQAIIFESEADTLSASLKQDWGNFSDLLRKSFHHEAASSSRKTNREYLEVEHPQLSIALSGTPGQVLGLIPSSENGLFSRFLFYCFDTPRGWRDVRPAGRRVQLADYFANLGHKTHDLMRHVASTCAENNSALHIKLDDSQWNTFNSTGQRWLAEVQETAESNAATGVVFRLSLSIFRIVMLLTLLRVAEHGKVPAGELLAIDEDLDAALTLGDVYLAHSLALLARMPRPVSGLVTPHALRADKEKRAKELKVQGRSVRDIALEIGVAKSTVGRWVQ